MFLVPYSITNSRNLHCPNQKGQRHAPVGALLYRDTGDSVVRRNVKPGILPVNQKDVLLRGLIVPAHLPRALEIDFPGLQPGQPTVLDRKSTRLNSSHGYISYAVFCLKKKTT